MASSSEFDVSETDYGMPPGDGSGAPFTGVLDGAGVSASATGKEAEWLTRMEAARPVLEELFAAAVGGDASVTLHAAGSLSVRELLERRNSGGATGFRADITGDCVGGIWLEPVAAGLMLECILGGALANAVPISRELSELERHFLRDLVCGAGTILFPPATATESETEDSGDFEVVSGHQLDQSLDPAAWVCCAEFQLVLAEGLQGSLIAIAPVNSDIFSPAEPSALVGASVRAARKRRLERLGGVMLDLEVTLEGNSIAFTDLVNLQVGDVIALESELTVPLTASLNSAGTFEGSIVPAGPRKAFRIEKILPPAL